MLFLFFPLIIMFSYRLFIHGFIVLTYVPFTPFFVVERFVCFFKRIDGIFLSNAITASVEIIMWVIFLLFC